MKEYLKIAAVAIVAIVVLKKAVPSVATSLGRISMAYVDPVVVFAATVWGIGRGSDAVSGEIGRGTYVRPLPGSDDSALLDLSLNALPPHAHVSELAGRLEIRADANRTALLDYPPRAGRDEHRVGCPGCQRRPRTRPSRRPGPVG